MRVCRNYCRAKVSGASNCLRGAVGWAVTGPQQRVEPAEIQRLQMNCHGPIPVPAAQFPGVALSTTAEAAGRADILAEVLGFSAVSDVGQAAAVSVEFNSGASQDTLWRGLCLRRWQGRQHSLHMRRWLAESGLRAAASEDLLADFASEEQMRGCESASQLPWASAPRRCRVATWRDRYVFAERDAKRTNISIEELCFDSPVDLTEAQGDLCYDASPPRFLRRWAVALYFDRPFDVEAFFHEDGTFNDTGRFRTSSVPWCFGHGPHGEVMVQVVVDRPNLPPLRVERGEDWGWRLVSTAQFEDMVVFTSRQLSPLGHEYAGQVDPDIITLYLHRCLDDGAVPHTGACGVWRCFGAFQGTMPARSWPGRRITIQPGQLTITMPNLGQDAYRCVLDEVSCRIDVMYSTNAAVAANGGVRDEEVVPTHVALGVYELHADGEVLVACRNERNGGVRPVGPPPGLPPVLEALEGSLRSSHGQCHAVGLNGGRSPVSNRFAEAGATQDVRRSTPHAQPLARPEETQRWTESL